MGNMICTGQCKAISPSICGAWDVGHLESSPTEIAWEPSGISGVGTKLFAVEEERRKQPDSTLLVITIIIIIIDKDLISGSTFRKISAPSPASPILPQQQQKTLSTLRIQRQIAEEYTQTSLIGRRPKSFKLNRRDGGPNYLLLVNTRTNGRV